MRIWNVVFTVALVGQSAMGGAQAKQVVSAPATRQLDGLSSQDAADIIAKLGDAQRRLKAGEFQSFELLAGSIASYEKTKVSPRDAFLHVTFSSVLEIKRVRTDN